MHSVLVVDADLQTRSDIAAFLSANNFVVHEASTADEMDAVLSETPIDLILVEVQLSGEGGLSICHRLRGPDAPGLILLSTMAEEVDRVIGLEMGADDFLGKPIAMRELLARSRSLIRRRKIPSDVRRYAGRYLFQDLQFRPAERRLVNQAGQTLEVTEQESALLRKFLESPGQVLQRDFLATVAPGDNAADLRAVDVQISRLRHKLAKGFGIDPIRTVRGMGYMLEVRAV